jgi:hypothetical protein
MSTTTTATDRSKIDCHLDTGCRAVRLTLNVTP